MDLVRWKIYQNIHPMMPLHIFVTCSLIFFKTASDIRCFYLQITSKLVIYALMPKKPAITGSAKLVQFESYSLACKSPTLVTSGIQYYQDVMFLLLPSCISMIINLWTFLWERFSA